MAGTRRIILKQVRVEPQENSASVFINDGMVQSTRRRQQPPILGQEEYGEEYGMT